MRRSRSFTLALGGLAVAIAAVVWCAHPICVRLSAADVAVAARWAPLETRTDRQWHGRVWQHRDGQWYQCKSWISREFFF